MALIQPLQNVPEEILQRYLTGSKGRELYEVTFISSIRPDPRDMDEIVLVNVVVRDWVQDSREMLERLTSNPQVAMIGRQRHELAVLSVISIGPVAGNSGGGIGEESMLVGKEENEALRFSQN